MKAHYILFLNPPEQTNKHIFHYSGIILETGQSVHITEWRIPKKILLKNCIIPTHSSEARAGECIEHTVAEISQFIENEVKSLRHIKSTIVRSYMFGDFRETKTELIFRLVQPSVNGKKLLKFTKSFDVQLSKKFLYKLCKNINIAIRDVNAYCDKTVDNWITEGSIFIDNNTDQVCVVYFGIFNSFKKILEGKYHQPTFNNDVVLGKLLNRLTTQMICAPQIRDLIQEFTTLEIFKVAELMERLELDMRQPSSTNNPHGSRLVTEFENFVELGRGAFGEVYKATSILDKNIYAIKVIEYSDNTSFDKCVQEAVLLGKLNHKYIVRYMTSSKDQNTIEAIQQQIKENNGEYSQTSLIEELTMDDTNNEVDNGNYYYKNSVLADPASQEINEWEPSLVDKKYLYIQMEYCGDRNLRRALDSNRDMKKMNSYAKQLTEGLKYIHSKKIYHRDLKPENIFLTNNGKQIKIGDFGLATNPQHNYCQDSPIRSFDLLSNNVGTNDYMAPELLQYPAIQRIKYTEQVDLYSLGIILFEMFSPPFSDRHERRKSIRLLRKLPIQFGNRCLVSDNIKTLITALLAYDPDLIEQNRPEAKQVHEELIILSKSPDKRTSSEIENLSEFFDRFSFERNCKRPKLYHFVADGLDRCEASDDFGR